jgi:alpha-methylacyl-CoA racemase
MSGPLAGVRVLEVGGIGPAPFAAMMLSDMGADVVRVDRPGADLMGAADPRHNTLHRGRRSVQLDARDERGLAALLQMAAGSHVLLEAFRPGVAERLGFGPDACLAVNPGLVYARMTGWGQTGPLAQTAGHDLTYLARTGAVYAVGPGESPAVPLNLVGDFGGGGAFCVVGILAALLESRTSGRGQVVDAAILDGAVSLTTGIRQMVLDGLWEDERQTNLMDGGCPWYTVYPTADGRHVAVGALEDKFYAELLSRLGLELDLDRGDRDNWPLIREALGRSFEAHDLAYWTAKFDESDACVAPVLTFSEAASDVQVRARGTLIEHGGVLQPAPAPRFSATPSVIQSAPSRTGADTREALRAWGVQDVDALIADGIAVQA